MRTSLRMLLQTTVTIKNLAPKVHFFGGQTYKTSIYSYTPWKNKTLPGEGGRTLRVVVVDDHVQLAPGL